MAGQHRAKTLNAVREATRVLDEHNIDQSQAIDVFELLSRLELIVVFQKLDGLLGAVVPTSQLSGVIITSQRKPAIQRYTAAHEIGHWILDQDEIFLDTPNDIFEPTSQGQEHLAQVFAGHLLMPQGLTHEVASRYQITSNSSPEPAQLYLFARDLGVSYQAAIQQLQSNRLLTSTQARSLKQAKLLDVKRGLANGHRPRVGDADIWPVDLTFDGENVNVSVEDEVVVALPEMRSTGHTWMDSSELTEREQRVKKPAPPKFAEPPDLSRVSDVAADPSKHQPSKSDITAAWSELPKQEVEDEDREVSDGLTLVSDKYSAMAEDTTKPMSARRILALSALRSDQLEVTAAEPTQPPNARVSKPAGGAGQRWLAVMAEQEGTWEFPIFYASPDPDQAPVAAFTISVTVMPTPAAANRRALVESGLSSGDQDDDEPEQ